MIDIDYERSKDPDESLKMFFCFEFISGIMTRFASYSIIYLHSLKILLLSVKAFVNLCPFILGLYRDKFVRICQMS